MAMASTPLAHSLPKQYRGNAMNPTKRIELDLGITIEVYQYHSGLVQVFLNNGDEERQCWLHPVTPAPRPTDAELVNEHQNSKASA
jgi:hypothetical protein